MYYAFFVISVEISEIKMHIQIIIAVREQVIMNYMIHNYLHYFFLLFFHIEITFIVILKSHVYGILLSGIYSIKWLCLSFLKTPSICVHIHKYICVM